MQQSSKSYPVIFDSAEKRLRFGVTDVGEFLDTEYKEQSSNKFYSNLIGRQHVSPHAKNEFTTADVVCEGYLFKKGSWLKNWKKRYFILRKDIRALCYYGSREDLVILGSIPLDIETRISNVQGEEADGYEHVICIEADSEEATPSKTFIRFESFEKMKAWMLDILNEAQSIVTPNEESVDWWTALFGNVSIIEPKSNSNRRDGLATSGPKEEAEVPVVKAPPIEVVGSEGPGSGNDGPDGGKQGRGEESEDDTDEEEKNNNTAGSTKSTKLTEGGADGGLSPTAKSVTRTSANALPSSRFSKMVKLLKQEKPYGPPPFEKANAARYETSQGTISGLQICLRLCNICGFQDRLFVVLFGSSSTASVDTTQSAAQANKPRGTAGIAPTLLSGTSSGGSRWEQLFRTELRMVKQRLSYSESSLNDVKIHFNVVESRIPDTYKTIRIVVYRQENEGTEKSTQQHLIAHTVLPRKIFDLRSVLKIKLKVKTAPSMDITVPIVKEPECIVGIVKLNSHDLYSHRLWFSKVFRVPAYAEKVYSFSTNSGMTMSVEQLYASRYSTSTAQALLTLWSSERQDYLLSTLQTLKQHFSHAVKEEEARLRREMESTGITTGVEDKIASAFEPQRLAIESIEEVFNINQLITSLSLEACENALEGTGLLNNVIAPEVGGGVLRRSAWKKIAPWQYVATNLNVHLLTSKVYSFGEIHSMMDIGEGGGGGGMLSGLFGAVGGASGEGGKLHHVPSITLGVPAAHELKFSDGGLRRIFQDVGSHESKLSFIQAIQYPTLESLQFLHETYPKEFTAIFGSKASFTLGEELAVLLKRKYELSRRLDVVSSQALGCALTTIRTILVLAAQGSALYMDILSRSLKIGWLVMFQSMLSTQGAELGMIEDLDIAVLWLSLVSVRFVTRSSTANLNAQSSSNPTSAANSVNNHTGIFMSGGGGSADDAGSLDMKALHLEGDSEFFAERTNRPIFVGTGEELMIRRDSTGRLIVDMEINSREASTILEALNSMSSFRPRPAAPPPTPAPPSLPAIKFSPAPAVVYAEGETAPRVYAITEVVGIAFTQGVNEMQTLANLSSSRDVMKQVEVNIASLSRLRDYYRRYRECLEFQLAACTPDMMEAISSGAAAGSAGEGSTAGGGLSRNPTLSPAPSSPMNNPSTSRSSLSPPPAPHPLTHSASTTNFPGGGLKKRRSYARLSMYGGGGNTSVGGVQNEALSAAVSILKARVLQHNDRLLDQLSESIAQSERTAYEKHVDVLLRSSALCRQMAGTVAILCKSGKDRTSMGVTLEQTRALVEDLGVLQGTEICQLMRQSGVRRMNVYANTGQSMFAFNQIQRRALPACYRPPQGSHAGNVTS